MTGQKMCHKNDPDQVAARGEIARKADILYNGWVTRILRRISKWI